MPWAEGAATPSLLGRLPSTPARTSAPAGPALGLGVPAVLRPVPDMKQVLQLMQATIHAQNTAFLSTMELLNR